MKEADIDAAVGRWLESRGLVPHYQVEMEGGRIDVVGRSHRLLVAVESKVRPSLALVEQALRWREKADEVWMAVEAATDSIRAVADATGVGLLRMCPIYGSMDAPLWKVMTAVEPVRHPRADASVLAAALAPEQTETEPGAGSGYVTRWSLWAERFRTVVRERGELPLKEAIAASDPHWGQTAYGRLRTVQGILTKGQPDPKFVGVVQEGRGAKAVVRWVDEGVF